DDNATNCGTTQITVLNANPMVSAGQDKNAQEGEVVPIAATFTDSGVDDTHTATIFWGDGTSSPGAVDQDTDSVTGSHVYANDGNFPVRVVVVDDDFGPGEGALVARVSNVATEIVALDLVSAQPIHVEGLPVALTANINDKGTRDSHTATIDWGDGTAIDAGSISENTFGPPGSTAGADGTVTGSHHYADNGSYDVTLCVSDDDVVTCRTQRIEVANAAPVVEAGGNFTVNEGAFTSLAPASFTDSAFDSAAIPSEENFTATIDWGDGTTEPDADITLVETPGSVGTLTHGTVQGSHAYGLYGTYSITVCVADDDHDPDSASPIDGQSCDTLIVTVNNVAPILDAGSDRSVFEGARFTMNPATFSDEGYNNEFTATIDWGDGTTEPEAEIVVVAVPGTKGTLLTGSVQAFHHYGDNGTYTIDVCLNDGRAVVCDTSSVTVINVEPSVDAGEDQITDEGTFITLDPATYSDPGFDNTSAPTQENFSATIDWGDGNFEPEPVTGPLDGITLTEHAGAEGALTTGTVQAAHAYGDNGVYTVTVCVTDDDNATTCDTLQVTVSNVPPSVVAGPDRVISESDAIFIGPPPGTGDQAPATYSDPGFDNLAADVPTLATQENFTSTIDWGEGTVDVGALTEAPGAEGALTTGKVSGSHVYGDDGTYTVTVCVTDDDLAQTCNTFTVTVLNVDPTLKDSVFLDPKITFTSGDDAFLGRKGIQQTHSAQATDIGSDDLRYDWTFSYNPDRFDGSLPPTNPTESTTTYNDGSDPSAQPFPDIAPFTDPAREEGAGLHPHGTFPFTSTDTTDVTFTGPGVYTVDLQVTDDNGGTDFATLPKLLTDDCDCVKGKGFWKKEFKERSEKDAKKVEKGQLIDGPTLVAYLDVIRFASSHFNERVPLNSFADAGNVLNTNTNRGSNNGSSNSKAPKDATKESATGSKKKKKAGSSSEGDSADGDSQANNLAKKREDALQQTLAAWLNFAKGGILWDEDVVVDTGTGSGTKARPSVVLPFNDIIAQVEAILNNPDATHDDLVHAKNLAESVNKHDDGNKDCGTGSGSVDGTASVSNKNGGDTKGSDSGSKAKGMKKGK
ncbi:MAG: PKD domain-containing protein, partial [SAR202 cluster bacterium]|nr:PKD domain-containing protein [SAR202 cluster bacterium]